MPTSLQQSAPQSSTHRSQSVQPQRTQSGNIYAQAGSLNLNIVRFKMDPADYYKQGPDPRNVSLPLLPTAPSTSYQSRFEHQQVVNSLY